jgi:hypothetical protein
MNNDQPGKGGGESAADECVRSHLRFGWWTLLVFLSLGIVLEALHGFKIGWYLDVSTGTRRLLFTLAHAHGTLLGLVHLAFAFTVGQLPDWSARSRKLASAMLKGATFLLPGGFFLGGLVVHGGDPGLGVLLVPVGALFLLIAVSACAAATGSRHRNEE